MITFTHWLKLAVLFRFSCTWIPSSFKQVVWLWMSYKYEIQEEPDTKYEIMKWHLLEINITLFLSDRCWNWSSSCYITLNCSLFVAVCLASENTFLPGGAGFFQDYYWRAQQISRMRGSLLRRSRVLGAMGSYMICGASEGFWATFWHCYFIFLHEHYYIDFGVDYIRQQLHVGPK